MPAIFGRSVIDVATNKSGGSLAKGDVVIVDTANDHAVTTTTSGATTATVGVVVEENGIANNATGRVQFAGYVALVNVNASVTRGHYAQTHTVAKQASGNSSRQAGSFGQFLTGGTTPSALLFGITDGSTGSGGIPISTIDAKGDLIGGTADNTVARLAVGANDTYLVAASGETTGLKWVAPLAVAVSRQTSGADYTTTSGTYADIDGTNLSLTITTGAHRVEVILAGHWTHSSTSFTGVYDVLIDGTGYGGNGVWQYRPIRNGEYWMNTYQHVTAALSAGSHTFKLQWKTTGGTFTLNRATFPGGLIFMVRELPI